MRCAHSFKGAVSIPIARAVASAAGLAGTGTTEISSSFCDRKSIPSGRERSRAGLKSSGNQETDDGVQKAALDKAVDGIGEGIGLGVGEHAVAD